MGKLTKQRGQVVPLPQTTEGRRAVHFVAHLPDRDPHSLTGIDWDKVTADFDRHFSDEETGK